jgi:hypothetical protein
MTTCALAHSSSSSEAMRRFSAKRHGGAVPHVRLEERLLAARNPVPGEPDERAHETVQLVLRAVVGVQRDVHRVTRRHGVGELGQCDGSGDHVLDGGTGQVLGAAGGDLDDPVASGFGEAAESRVQRLAR